MLINHHTCWVTLMLIFTKSEYSSRWALSKWLALDNSVVILCAITVPSKLGARPAHCSWPLILAFKLYSLASSTFLSAIYAAYYGLGAVKVELLIISILFFSFILDLTSLYTSFFFCLKCLSIISSVNVDFASGLMLQLRCLAKGVWATC